jgi:predicted NAD-dependent protein-ADP-ribosyltransferase YbiA (DUF1768 family)
VGRYLANTGWFMQKQDRIERAAKRTENRKMYAKQDAAVVAFCEQCRIAMPKSTFSQWHDEAIDQAGNSFHVFEHMLYALSVAKTPIGPQLRKSIDYTLECHNIERDRLEVLSSLEYDDYWKTQYGYS